MTTIGTRLYVIGLIEASAAAALSGAIPDASKIIWHGLLSDDDGATFQCGGLVPAVRWGATLLTFDGSAFGADASTYACRTICLVGGFELSGATATSSSDTYCSINENASMWVVSTP
jgi:hypothetical protein